jgi:hypothetical protein
MRLKTAAFAVALICGTAPCAAQQRWQLTRTSGDYLWDLQLVKLEGTSLVVRQADSSFAVPVSQITELRRVGKAMKRMGDGGRGVFAGLMGADDEVYQLTLDTVAERVIAIREILRRHGRD